jgi:hypothetical protein
MPAAKPKGARIKRGNLRGKTISFTIYMRPHVKAIIVKAAAKRKLSVNRFLQIAGLEKASNEKNLMRMLPADEYQALVFNKYPKKRKPKR